MSLAELDVRVKLVAFLAIMVAVLLISHPLGSALLLVAVMLAVTLGGAPLRGWWRMMQPLVVVFVFIVPFAAFTTRQFGNPELSRSLLGIGVLQATPGGLLVGVNFVLRITLMVLVTHAFIVSTTVDDLLAALSALHAPYWLAILVTTALGLIPILVRKKDQIAQAQAARGTQIRKGPVGRIVGFIPLMVPLLTGTILLAEGLAVAMTNRGYGATNAMTPMRELRCRASDWLVLAASIGMLGLVVWLRYGLGHGVL